MSALIKQLFSACSDEYDHILWAFSAALYSVANIPWSTSAALRHIRRAAWSRGFFLPSGRSSYPVMLFNSRYLYLFFKGAITTFLHRLLSWSDVRWKECSWFVVTIKLGIVSWSVIRQKQNWTTSYSPNLSRIDFLNALHKYDMVHPRIFWSW